MENPDGTANCDRCGRSLPAYGVMHGMISSDLDGASVRRLIVCYLCRSLVLDGLVNYFGPTECTHCGTTVAPGVVGGLLAHDVTPVYLQPRRMIFCYINGSAPLYLAQLSI